MILYLLCDMLLAKKVRYMWLEAIRIMKSKSGLTTSEIAAKSGIPEPTLEKLFAGKVKDPKLPTMQKLVHFFGYTLDDLDKKENPPASPEDEEGELTVDEVVSAFVSAGIVPEGRDLTGADLRFLLAIMDAIDRWFAN